MSLIGRVLAWLVAILGVAAASAEPLPASDSWWLLAAGRFLAETSQIQTTDPFSFTGGAWFNHEWLFGLGAYELYRVAGWEGLYWARTLALVLAFAVLPLWAVRKSPEATWATGLLAALYAWFPPSRPFYDVRPYLATYVLMAVCLVLVRAYLAAPRRGYLVAVIVLTALWANLHGAFILGPGMLLVAGAGCWLEKRPCAQLLVSGVLAWLAALCNPYGWHMLAFPFSLFGDSAFRLGLNEWARPDLFGEHALYWVVAAVGVAATVLYWRSGQRALALLTLVFTLGGFTAWRQLPLACLAGVQLHAVVLRARQPVRLGLAWAALLVVLFCLPARLARTPRELGLWDVLFPSDAVRFLLANPDLPHRLCNPYEWGGWLTWHAPGWRIMIDGRAHTVYPEQVYIDSLAIQFGGAWEKKAGADWQTLLHRYEVDLVLATRLQGDLEQRLEASPDWELLFRDHLSALYLRRGVLHPPLVFPDTADSLCAAGMKAVQEGHWDQAAVAFQKAVELAPGDPRAHVFLGVARLRAGFEDDGVAQLEQALRIDPAIPDAHFNLAAVYRRRGDLARARAELEEELRVNPDHAGAKKALADLPP